MSEAEGSKEALSRRRLFAGAGTAGAIAAVAAVMPRAPAEAPERPQAEAASAEAAPGYRASAHVLRYYQTARV